MLGRLLVTGVVAGTIGVAGAVAGTATADAHPLGNATVNHYDGLELFTDHIVDTAVVDAAEIPTLQRLPTIDTDGDGTVNGAEAAAYAARQCTALAAELRVSTDAGPVALTTTAGTFRLLPGAAGLQVGRLECSLSAPADLSRPTTVSIDDEFDAAGIGGWHEITAIGRGVVLQSSPVPAASVSDELRRYPNDLLSSPLDVRTARIPTVAGAGLSSYLPVSAVPGADGMVAALNQLSTAFNELVGAKQMSLGVALLAVLLSIALGAGHAFLPGHGKTIMAAYLVGKRGRLRDVVTVGATVTITHTVGVLVLGVLLSVSAALAPTAIEQALAVVSGLVVAGVGIGLLASAIRRRHDARVPGTTALLEPAHAIPGHSAAHGHGHGGHGHGGHGHDGFGRRGLVGLGVAGGLVPSPSALLVLLAAIALGRTAFGVVLVLGYGLGMALALTLAGLLLVRMRNRIATQATRGRLARLEPLLGHLPILTALLVILVGTGLVLRALSGSV